MRALLAALLLAWPVATSAQVVGAAYDAPSHRYGHNVLGTQGEWDALVLTLADGRQVRIVPPDAGIFEDTAPRLADLDGDGAPEVVTVRTSLTRGAALVVYGPEGEIAATPPIGAPHRWIAVVGIADLDGDGRPEIAVVDRPHLAKVLRLYGLRDGRLVELAAAGGLTNHHFGEATPEGGIRTCGGLPEVVVADGQWQRILAARLVAGRILGRDLGRYRGPASLAAALRC
ncbi:MAG: VCBS repeat-containing protein [Limimaricola sp.]|uniref:FG-GAP repeat domain-containing protein n=1 Tax=Limimaricola sp. TaxID=2211665 RepID=UPI001E054F00|nr:VCBS repeat-containing protein [Limimaricola sp.]MBI1416558.1 VCBS repeat-containing protein [Limimaricola sp.]